MVTCNLHFNIKKQIHQHKYKNKVSGFILSHFDTLPNLYPIHKKNFVIIFDD